MKYYRLVQQGFTLIELMITVAILAVLAAIAIPSYQNFIIRGYEADAQAEMRKIAMQLEKHRARQFTYAGFIPENEVPGITQRGRVNLPFGASGAEYNYQIQIFDASNRQNLQGQSLSTGWRMIANPNQNKSARLKKAKSFVIDSKGLDCMRDNQLYTTSSISC